MDRPTPAARVTWSTTAPPQCVTAVRVEFRTGSDGHTGRLEVTYTATNTSQTEVIQTDLQCATNYFITVVVTGPPSGGLNPTWSSRAVQVLVGGKEIACMRFDWYV